MTRNLRAALARTARMIVVTALTNALILIPQDRPAAAAALAGMSWTLSTAAASAQNSRYVITFTAPTSIPRGNSGTITYPFPAAFNVPAAVTFADMTLTVNGAAQLLAAGSSNTEWGVGMTTGPGGQIVLTNCRLAGCATAANATYVLTVGDGAAGGTDEIINSGLDGTYNMTITTRNGTTVLDTGTVGTTVSTTLTCSVSHSGGASSLAFDLTGTASDSSKSSTVTITSNVTHGYKLTIAATQAPTHTAYNATLPNWTGASTTVATTWPATEPGFGYSLNGGTTYFAFDTATPRTIGSGTTTVGTVNVTVNYRVTVRVGVDPAGIYVAEIYFGCVPIT